MQKAFALALFATLAVSVIAVPVSFDDAEVVATYSTKGITMDFYKIPEKVEAPQKLFGCGTCASLTGQSLNILLNYILNAGVVGGCSKLCGQLKDKTTKTICNLGCDLVGVKAFAKAIEKADLDPIYFCEELGACKTDDNGAGSIKDLSVTPASAKQATTFTATMEVTVTNHTGAGEFRFGVHGGVDPSSGAGNVYPELNPGSYGVKLSIDTTPSSDPTQGNQWIPGPYTVSGAFCMGTCGSKHPHSKIFGQTNTTFTISGM